MTVLWIVLGVLLGLILLVLGVVFLGKARLRIQYDRELRITASICGVRFYKIGAEETKQKKKKNLSRCRNPEHALKKKLNRQKKAAKKAYLKTLKKKKKTAKLALEKKRLRANAPSLGIQEELGIIFDLLKTVRDYTKGRILIRVRKMKIRIATEDAAKTAILYGVAVQTVACLLEWIDKHFNSIHRNDGDMEIYPNYLASTSEAKLDLECSMRPIQLLELLIHLQETHEKSTAKAVRKKRQKELAEKSSDHKLS